MARKLESNFIARIHKQLPKEIYREKMANPYRGGTPDVYYEGNKSALWVEYKFWISVPKLINIQNIVSPLQRLWLVRAQSNDIKVGIIIGYKKGGMIFRIDDSIISGNQFKDSIKTIRDLVDWIKIITIK